MQNKNENDTLGEDFITSEEDSTQEVLEDKGEIEYDSEEKEVLEEEEEEEEESSSEKDEKKKNQIKLKPVLLATSIVIGGFLYFNGIESNPKSINKNEQQQTNQQKSIKPDSFLNKKEEIKEVISTKRVKVYDGNELFEHKKQTLSELNTSESYIAMVNELKKQVDSIKKEQSRKLESSNDRDRFNKTKREGIMELNKRLNFGNIHLKNGSIVRPSLDQNGYEVETKSGILATIKNGSYIKVKEGFLITDTSTDNIYIVFSHMQSGSKAIIDNLYKISSRRGLEDLTVSNYQKSKSTDGKTVENKKIFKLINGITNIENQNYQTEKIIKKVVFFNENGLKSGSEEYLLKITTTNDNGVSELKNLRQELVGFKLNDQRVFKKDGDVIKLDGEIKSFDGLTSDLRMVYKTFDGGKKTNKTSYIQIINGRDGEGGEEVLSEWETNEIQYIFLKTYLDKQKNERYIVRGNKLMKTKGYDLKEVFYAKGYILGELVEGKLGNIKVIETSETSIKEDVSKFEGKILIGEKGFYLPNKRNEYKIENKKIEDKLRENIEPASNFSLFENRLSRENGTVVDKIKQIKTIQKVGAKLTTKDLYIYLSKKGQIEIENRETGERKKIIDVKVYFKNNYLIVTSEPESKLDKINKTINGKSYNKIIDKTGGFKQFIDNNGNYIYNKKGGIDHKTEREIVLKEKVTSIEEIDGDLFSFIYIIDEETGKLIGKKVGELNVKMKNPKLLDLIKKHEDTIIEKKVKQSKKNVLTLKEMLNNSPFLFNVTFKMMNEDSVKIVSQNSILLNGNKIMLKSGRYNQKEKLFIFDINKETISKTKTIRDITGSVKRTTFERTISKIENDIKDYYTDEILVYTTEEDIRRVRYQRKINGNQKLETWSIVYSSNLNLKDKQIVLEIEPAENSTKTTEVIKVNLSDIKTMKKSMRQKFEIDYEKYMKKSEKIEKSKGLKKINNNAKILEAEKIALELELKTIMGKNLEYIVEGLTKREKEKIKQKENEVPEFTFEIGKEFHYKIEKSVEIAEGETKYMSTDLKEGYFNDRLGNSLTLNDPKVVIAVTGDFNTNKVKFTPIKIVFTDDIGERRNVSIPQTATILEYEESESGYTLDGVPAFYVNQKVKELPTTVMLSTVAGVLDSLSASDDDIASQLGSIGDLGGDSSGDDSTNPFTDGASEGISAGVKDILEVYKSKSENKKDILITTGEIELKSKFIQAVQVQLDDTEQQGK